MGELDPSRLYEYYITWARKRHLIGTHGAVNSTPIQYNNRCSRGKQRPLIYSKSWEKGFVTKNKKYIFMKTKNPVREGRRIIGRKGSTDRRTTRSIVHNKCTIMPLRPTWKKGILATQPMWIQVWRFTFHEYGWRTKLTREKILIWC